MKKFNVTVDGQTYTVFVEEIGEQTAAPAGVPAQAALPREAPVVPEQAAPPRPSAVPAPAQGGPGPAAGGGVPAPMPGSIIELKVREGDTVKKGDVLLILEAMKMENEVTAPRGGTVTRILVKKGDTVNSGDPLLEIV
jgi:glutaconyl-CoA/methylmalonyl-CoA decarboxylase subunit gamma